MVAVEVAELDPGIPLDLRRLAVGPEVRDVDDEAIGFTGAMVELWLVPLDGREVRQPIGPDHVEGLLHEIVGPAESELGLPWPCLLLELPHVCRTARPGGPQGVACLAARRLLWLMKRTTLYHRILLLFKQNR